MSERTDNSLFRGNVQKEGRRKKKRGKRRRIVYLLLS